MKENIQDNSNLVEQVITEAEKINLEFKTAREILEFSDNSNIWVVENLIPEGCTILAGTPKSYKTYLAIHIANCLTNENLVFGKFKVCGKKKILVIDRENSQSLIKRRLEQLKVNKDAAIYWHFDPTPISSTSYKKKLLDKIQELAINFLIIDSFRRFHPGDENSSESIAKTFQFISEIRALGVSVLIVHHLRKASRMNSISTEQMLRGSSDLIAYPDAMLGIKKTFDNPNTVLKIEQPIVRAAEELSPFSADVISTGGSLEFRYKGIQPGSIPEPILIEEEILEVIKNKTQVSKKEISEYLKGKFSRRMTDDVLKRLTQERKIIKEIASRGRHIFRIPTSNDQTLLEGDSV